MVAAAAFALYAIAEDVKSTRQILKVEPRLLIGSGVLAAAFSGLIPLLTGKPFLTAMWLKEPLPPLVDMLVNRLAHAYEEGLADRSGAAARPEAETSLSAGRGDKG